MKRAPALVPLSRDHHHGLLLCWKIRTGVSGGIEISRIVAYLLHCYDFELEKHFRQEENHVFPLPDSTHPLIIEALQQHAMLRNMIGLFRHTAADNNMLLEFASLLEMHIRFEERELFPYIESTATETQMASLAVHTSHPVHPALVWEDEFWLQGHKRGEA